MRLSILAAFAAALTGTQAFSGDLVWSLGVENDSSAEFLPYSNNEFQTNSQIAKLPGFDRKSRSFAFAFKENAQLGKPEFPAGISGTGPGCDAYITDESISWNEQEGGFRLLEIKIIDSHSRDFSSYKLRPNENMDIDGMDIVKHSLRVALPDGQLARQYLPYDVGSYIKTKGPIVVKAFFKAEPGKNSIFLKEDSGHTYGRCCHFDFIRLSKVSEPEANPPVLELTPESGFHYATLFKTGAEAVMKAKAFNLDPSKSYDLKVKFLDYFGKELSSETKSLRPGPDGSLELLAKCPSSVSGHIRAIGSLSLDGKALELQMGLPEITLRLASLRMVAEPSDVEIERSFVGVCGMPATCYFDPYQALDSYKAEIERYRSYRSALQIHNERIHSLAWNMLEKEEGSFRWEFWDWMLDGEKEARIRVQLGILGTPKWLVAKHWKDRLDGHIAEWIFSCPPEMDKWANACSTIASRYKDRVADFEIWNEPSEHSLFWFKGSAEDYFALVKTGSEAIRKAAPGANVVSETVWARQMDFWQRLYKLGVAQYVDFPADHYMTDERIELVNRFLDANGRGKGLINNESKCDSVPGNGETDEAKRREAARNLMRNMVHMNANRILRIYNFVITGSTWRVFGLVGPDGTPKYSFSSMKTLVNRTTGAEFNRQFDFAKDVEACSYKYFSPERAKENGGDNVLFLFNKGKEPVRLPLYVGKPEVSVVDLMDNASTVKAEGGILKLELGEDPLMVIGADLQALETQSAVSMSNLSYDAAPGDTLKFSAKLAKGIPSVDSASVRIDAKSLSQDPSSELELMPGEEKAASFASNPSLQDGVYSVSAETEIMTTKGTISIPRSFDVVLTKTKAGANFFQDSTFSKASKDWSSWGDAKVESLQAEAAPSTKISVSATGGMKSAAAISLVEGQTYHLSFKARGQGALRVMFTKKFADGREEVDHNFICQDLSPEWREIYGDFAAPSGIRSLQINFYEYKTSGWAELSELLFTRVPKGVPINRILFSASAKPAGSLNADSAVADWPKDWLVQIPASGVRMNGYGGDADLSASFASAWSGQTLLFLILVKDDKNVEGKDASALYQSDSVQMDFEPANVGTRTESCQFAFGSVDGKAASFRHKTIPSEDIVPSYKIGPSPEGVSVKISREGSTTAYRVAIQASAISPTLSLSQGKRIAFSLLVNDNDGSGRKGWLQWSGGIGDVQDSTLFGTLELK